MKHKKTTFTVGRLVATLFSLLCLSTFAHADDDLGTLEDLLPPGDDKPAQRSFNGTVQLFDQVLIHPMPVWSLVANGPAPGERSKFRRSREGNAFRMEVVPKDESFDVWNSRFTIVAFDNSKRSITQQANNLAQFIRSQCSPTNLRIFPGNHTAEKLVMVSACGNFSRKKEKGQMMAAVLLKKGDLNVSLLREWRGPNFQASITDRWPVSRREIDGVLEELIRARLVPAQ